jgi:hypothetical protein
LEINILVVVVVVVTVDPVVDVGHSIEYGEGHPGEHEWDQLRQLSSS